MTDPPTLGELMRVIQAMRDEQRDFRTDINGRLDRLVSAEVFNREISRVDNAIHSVTNRLIGEITDRREAVRTVRADCKVETDEVVQRLDKVSANVKWLMAAIVLPVALFIANLVFANNGG